MEKLERIAVLGGSFDPPTIAHIQISIQVVQSGICDAVWLIPCGTRKDKRLSAEPADRLKMLELSIQDYLPSVCPIEACGIEIEEGKFIPTYFLFQRLEAKYPSKQFRLIIGTDLLASLRYWIEGEKLWNENKFIVVDRWSEGICATGTPPFSVDLAATLRDKGLQLITSSVSSTEMRKRLATEWARMIEVEKEVEKPAAGYSAICRTFVSPSVLEYIESKQLYTSTELIHGTLLNPAECIPTGLPSKPISP